MNTWTGRESNTLEYQRLREQDLRVRADAIIADNERVLSELHATGIRVRDRDARDAAKPLYPGAPLYVVREEVEALREMMGDGMLVFNPHNVVDCLDSILRTIARVAVEVE